MRIATYVASVALVVWAVLVVPMPYEKTVPGRARPVEDMVTIGVETDEVNGDLALLTVRDRDATVIDVLAAAVRSGQQLQPLEQPIAPGLDDRNAQELYAQQFANSFTTAVAAAAERAGYDVEVTTSVAVGQVVSGGPSAGILSPGDVIRSIEDTPVVGTADLLGVLQSITGLRPVDLVVERDGQEVAVTVDLEVLEVTGRPGLGIFPLTVTDPVALPFDVQLADSNIVGPSAGLMIAVTVADLLLDEDLADGRRVSGTGALDGTGAVLPIGSLPYKVETAVMAGSDVMLVPAEQATEARNLADGRIEVIGVATLDEAIDALRGDRLAAGGGDAP